MRRIMQPDAVGVIGPRRKMARSATRVMKNLINVATRAHYPIHTARRGNFRSASVTKACSMCQVRSTLPFFAFQRFVAQVLAEVGKKNIPGAI